ncbi:Unknown protein, partial [Striga hermonthica]
YSHAASLTPPPRAPTCTLPTPWAARCRVPCLARARALPSSPSPSMTRYRAPAAPLLFLVGSCLEPISTIPISTRNMLPVTFPDLPRITPVTDLPRAFRHSTAFSTPARISIRALPIPTRIRLDTSFLHSASRVSSCAPRLSSSTPMPTRSRPSPASPPLACLAHHACFPCDAQRIPPVPMLGSPTAYTRAPHAVRVSLLLSRASNREQRREEYEREDDFDRRSQASNYHDHPKPEKLRITLSTFNGNNPEAWLNRAVQYFDLNETEGRDRVRYAAYYLDGEANVWWQWLTSVYRSRQRVIRWNDFERELLTCFGSSDYHNYHEALSRIRQTGSLRDYLKEFERLACRVQGWPETALVGTFIGGLKYDLAAEVRLERPESMHAAMEVARRREDHLVATRRGWADARYPETRRTQPDASDMVPSGQPPDNSRLTNSTRPPVKHLTLEEIKRRREKGLCFKCEERFTPGHQCKQAFVIHVIDPNEEEPEVEKDWEQEVKIGVPEEEAEISMHAMAG